MISFLRASNKRIILIIACFLIFVLAVVLFTVFTHTSSSKIETEIGSEAVRVFGIEGNDDYAPKTEEFINQYISDSKGEIKSASVVKDSMTTYVENEHTDDIASHIKFDLLVTTKTRGDMVLTVSVVGTLQSVVGEILNDQGNVLAKKVYQTF